MRRRFASAWTLYIMGWRNAPMRVSLATFLAIAAGVAWPALAVALRAGTDAALNRDGHSASIYGAVIGVGVIGVLMFRHFSYALYIDASEASVIALEAELTSLVSGLRGLEIYESAEYADKVDILRRDCQRLALGMQAIIETGTLAISLAMTGVLLASVNPWLFLLSLAAVPPVLAGNLATKIVERGKESAASSTRQAWHLFRMATSATSAQELRVCRLQSEILRRDQESWSSSGQLIVAAERKALLLGALGQLVFASAYVAGVLVVLRETVARQAGVGDLVLVITLSMQVNQQVAQSLQQLRILQSIASGFARLEWLRGLVERQASRPPSGVVPTRFRTGIELRNVSFTYPGSMLPSLSSANLRIPPGATVAIVGENGAGKTTLVKLLCRFYEPTEGAVLLDGVELPHIPVAQWRNSVAVAFQDFVRFELLARESVGVGYLPGIDDDEVVLAALSRAGARDLVERLPSGLSTPLGKSHSDGVDLSGGQWQRLALARAFMRPSPLLLILDEPSAALDAEAEHHLFETYAAGAQRVARDTGGITIFVTHRFSTARHADMIVVIDDGRILESGTHDELIAFGGRYAHLYELTATAYR